ncbi:MAG: RHS repeat-associated core domain-containing protein [Candidatus Sulfotelmatobacter sp.]
MNGQAAKTIRIPLPGGGTAELLGATDGTNHILHSDWLGSSRLSTSFSNHTMAYDVAYAPYGENHAGSGGVTSDLNFTGQSQDTLSGLYEFLYRKHSPAQGRWISPDPAGLAAVDFSNPQSWNRYAYVNNSPLSNVDPTGLFCSGPTYTLGACNAFNTTGGSGWNEFDVMNIPIMALTPTYGYLDPTEDITSAPSIIDPINEDGTVDYVDGYVVGNNTTVNLNGYGATGWMETQVGSGFDLLSAANNGTPPVSCNSTTGICVPSSMVTGPSNWQRLKKGVKWYLCGNGSFDNIKNYTLEGFTKGAIVGGIAGWEGGPPGVALGALGGGVEGFFSGNAVGWVATAGCQAAGMYPPAS